MDEELHGPVEVPDEGALAVHVKPGGTIILAFADGVDPGRARSMRDLLAANAPESTVIALDGLAAVRSWHPDEAADELSDALAKAAGLQDSCKLLGQVLVSQARSLYGAWIEINRDDAGRAREWILNGVSDVDDNDPDDRWNGTETADEWFDRTQDDGLPPKPQAQAVGNLRALLAEAVAELRNSSLKVQADLADSLSERAGLDES